MVDGEDELDEGTYKGILHHILVIRSELAKKFWQQEIYIGVSIIDEYIFFSAKKTPNQICQKVISLFKDSYVGNAGFVLYPLHGFGIEQSSLFHKNTKLKRYLHFQNMGICISQQSNNFEVAAKRVSEMASKLGVLGKIDHSTLNHHTTVGAMNWFKSNPLMMVKIVSHTGSYYENQFIYALKIRIAAAFAAMLYAVGANRGCEVDSFASSASINNWETLDIKHYLIGEARNKKSIPVDLRRVPMNVAALDLARLSDLTLTLSPKTLNLAFLKSFKQRFGKALKTIEMGHLTHVNTTSGDKVRRRVFSRIVTAIDWYRQSFSVRVTDDEAVVALAVAFETLLTDAYGRGVSARINRRVAICLKGKRGVVKYISAVNSVMEARGAIVHNGSTMKKADVVKAQAAFALCFEDVVNRLHRLGTSLDAPIGKILEN